MLRIFSDEVNKKLDSGTNFVNFCPEWKKAQLFKEWQRYAKMSFKGGLALSPQTHHCLIPVIGDVQTTQKDRSKTIKTPIEINIKSNGCPEIPVITPAHGYKTKVVQAMLREYCTTHICEPSIDLLFPCVTKAYQVTSLERRRQLSHGQSCVKIHPPGSSLNVSQMAFSGRTHLKSASDMCSAS